MRLAELTTRALLGGMAWDRLDSIGNTSPNTSNLLVRQSGCEADEELCGTRCMPRGAVCCVP